MQDHPIAQFSSVVKETRMALRYIFLISFSLASYHVKKGENDRGDIGEIYGCSSFLISQDVIFYCILFS
jgi:hypothetical protein